MILWNGKPVVVEKYPDQTQRINLTIDATKAGEIKWMYEGEEELATLIYLTKHIREKSRVGLTLWLLYIPNARMDRTHREQEVFTLKYFAEVINWLGFEEVKVLDPHSNVSVALLDRCKVIDLRGILNGVIENIEGLEGQKPVLYFPDAGAYKKYTELLPEYKNCYGMKKRDWDTGKILGLEIVTNGVELAGQVVLMVDDIVAFGGTMHYGARKLTELGARAVYGYCSHAENSVLDEENGTLLRSLKDGMVKKLYTTNSIYRGSCEHIEVVEV